jgi:hemoglobin
MASLKYHENLYSKGGGRLRHGKQMTGGVAVDEYDIYALIGEEGFTRLVGAFYKQVPDDAVLGPMYAGRDLHEAELRLRDFMIFRFGGPSRYLDQRGHPRLRMRHVAFPIDQKARDRWVQLMGAAFQEAMLPPEAERVLRAFFESTASFLVNKAEP